MIDDTDEENGHEAKVLRAVMDVDDGTFRNLSACYIFDSDTNVSQPL
jgi:hypothetical protein